VDECKPLEYGSTRRLGPEHPAVRTAVAAAAAAWAAAGVEEADEEAINSAMQEAAVVPRQHCLPRNPTHFNPSFQPLELHDTV
jgi:hypothetical protein